MGVQCGRRSASGSPFVIECSFPFGSQALENEESTSATVQMELTVGLLRAQLLQREEQERRPSASGERAGGGWEEGGGLTRARLTVCGMDAPFDGRRRGKRARSSQRGQTRRRVQMGR